MKTNQIRKVLKRAEEMEKDFGFQNWADKNKDQISWAEVSDIVQGYQELAKLVLQLRGKSADEEE